MANPWDIPKPEPIGSPDANSVYRGVGQALSEWEMVETACARIFAFLVGASTEWGEISPAVRAFGTVISFPGRREMIAAAGKAFFHRNAKLSEYEKWINDALVESINYSARRNEIAHGVVREIIDRDTRRSVGYYLLPSFYNPKKFSVDFLPSYQYQERNLSYFRQEFTKLGLKLESILRLLQKDAKESSEPQTEQISPPVEDQNSTQ